jgi:hypothetical protein
MKANTDVGAGAGDRGRRTIAAVVALLTTVVFGLGLGCPGRGDDDLARHRVPGIGEVVARRRAGPDRDEGPLDQPSAVTVTVPWTTLYVPGAPDPRSSAPASHYGPPAADRVPLDRPARPSR